MNGSQGKGITWQISLTSTKPDAHQIGNDEINSDGDDTVAPNRQVGESQSGLRLAEANHVGYQVEVPAKKLADSVGAEMKIHLPTVAIMQMASVACTADS